ncbi:hypothetical protein CCACVL1_25724 [Corchorus capsularis]|uniref:Uncharacterized protein n=1 Tax=Corchorus capsularis TaxID=210143 RepID=A0A1R3GHX0_COCAP|nr:hypothetical protein CCACVL1_25724 [Corchorus capsularis]
MENNPQIVNQSLHSPKEDTPVHSRFLSSPYEFPHKDLHSPL